MIVDSEGTVREDDTPEPPKPAPEPPTGRREFFQDVAVSAVVTGIVIVAMAVLAYDPVVMPPPCNQPYMELETCVVRAEELRRLGARVEALEVRLGKVPTGAWGSGLDDGSIIPSTPPGSTITTPHIPSSTVTITATTTVRIGSWGLGR